MPVFVQSEHFIDYLLDVDTARTIRNYFVDFPREILEAPSSFPRKLLQFGVGKHSLQRTEIIDNAECHN